MADVSYAEAGSGRVSHIRVHEGESVWGSAAPALEPMHWLPLAKGRYADVPVTGSNGETYVVLNFELSIDRQVKQLLTTKPKSGPFAVTDESIDKAIERLVAARGATPPKAAHASPVQSGRLIDASLIDGFNNIYRVWSGPILAVLDGDVVLPPSCYELRPEEGAIQMKKRPVYSLRILVP